MKRRIYEVYAKVVDANGNYNTLSGYPKAFDSKNYGDNFTKTENRARAEFHSALAAMYVRDDRPFQEAILLSTSGDVLEIEKIGDLEAEEIVPDENS